MNIRPSATIRQNYNEIADMCKETKEDRISGRSGCTLDELDKYLDDIIEEV